MNAIYNDGFFNREDKMKLKSRFLIIIIVLLTLTGCGTYSKEELALLDFIQEFYETQYEAYSKLEYIDIEPYLDMEIIQNKNKVIALKKLIIQRAHMDDMKYGYVDRVKRKIEYYIEDIDISGESASINIYIEFKENRNYPEFIYSGENRFFLKKLNNKWKIVNHDYDGLHHFEITKKELLPELDEGRIKRVIDNEFGKSPFSS